MAQYFTDYSSPPFEPIQTPPADHVSGGQDSSMFSLREAPAEWAGVSVGGNAIRALRSGLNTSTSYIVWTGGEGATIASEGKDVDLVTRVFRGTGGTTPIRVTLLVRSNADASAAYMLGLRRGGGGEWYAEIVEIPGFNTLASSEIGAIDDSFPTNTETWLRVSAQDAGGVAHLKVKFWAGAAGDQPTAWNVETTHALYHGVSGYVGFRHTRGEFWHDVLGVGTNGDPAPTGPVAVGLPTLSAPTLDAIAPWAGTPTVTVGYS